MKEIIIGFGVIIGIILSIYTLVVFCGILKIFFTNLFSSTTYITYNWNNIYSESVTGLGILFFVILGFILCYMVGQTIIH